MTTTDTQTCAMDLLAALVLEDGTRWGDVAADFQIEDAEAVFSDDGPVWHLITRPRGGSKTTDLAGVALCWLATTARPGARGYVFASSKDQAALLLDAASGLVGRTPELNEAVEVQATKLVSLRTGATMEIRAAEGGTTFGLRASFALVDELAQWEERRRARRLWTAITSALAQVPGCKFVCLTSAGEPGHWSHKVLQDALKAPDRWRVSETPGPLPWLNPADLEAQGLRDSEYSRLHLNIWTQSEDRLVSAADLLAAAVLDGEQEPRAGVQYLISVDLGLVNDKTVVAVGHSEEISPEPGVSPVPPTIGDTAHITKRVVKSGNRYDVKFTVNGQHRRQTFEKKAEADAFVTSLKAAKQAGRTIDLRRGERLFGSYADEWIETRLVRGEPLSPATTQGYRALMRRHLLPAFGQTRLNQINKDRVRKWHNTLAVKQPDQAAKAYRLLRAILMTAADDDLIAENPCRIKGAGEENAAERPMLETETVMKLAEAIEPRLRAMVLIAGFRTMRTGELLGLQRRDVDLLHTTIRVERQTQEVVGGRIVRDATKSQAGKRTLALPPFLADILDEHLRLYVGPEPGAWLFTRATGRPLRRQDLSHAWQDACKAVGVTPWSQEARTGVRFYDLRHHAGTISAQDPNVTLKELMTMMGHSTTVAAMRYQHATEERDRDHATTYLEGVIQKAANGTPKSAPVRIHS